MQDCGLLKEIIHYRSLLRLDVLLAALESFLIFAYSYINMSTDRELDTPSLTAVSEQDDSQRSSVITVETASPETPSSSILDNIAQELQMEAPCAPRVLDQLATIANNLAREKLPDDTLASKYKLYDRPENCTALLTVKVNPPIWDKLKSETRSNDLKFQKVQTALNKSLIAMVQVTDALTKSLTASEKKDLPSTEDMIR